VTLRTLLIALYLGTTAQAAPFLISALLPKPGPLEPVFLCGHHDCACTDAEFCATQCCCYPDDRERLAAQAAAPRGDDWGRKPCFGETGLAKLAWILALHEADVPALPALPLHSVPWEGPATGSPGQPPAPATDKVPI
jgi:hypothetical protein